jgi:hypothetical protein
MSALYPRSTETCTEPYTERESITQRSKARHHYASHFCYCLFLPTRSPEGLRTAKSTIERTNTTGIGVGLAALHQRGNNEVVPWADHPQTTQTRRKKAHRSVKARKCPSPSFAAEQREHKLQAAVYLFTCPGTARSSAAPAAQQTSA